MSFSDRLGITQPKTVLQTDSIDDDLRNGLWEACREFYVRDFGNRGVTKGTTFGTILKDIYVNHWRMSSDNILLLAASEIDKLKQHFQQVEWFHVYNLVEFLSGVAVRNFPSGNAVIPNPAKYDTAFRTRVNFFLEREKSAYRFVGDSLVPISSDLEISEIEEAIGLSDKFSGARSHIRHAVALFGQKPQPDYRNAVKEAMSAVESVVRVVTDHKKATLGDALKKLDEIKPLHPAFKQAMEKLYGYTSDEGGIRHSLIDLAKVDEADAKFMIVTCSAFVNFCVQRL
jgi:hypothetical protein